MRAIIAIIFLYFSAQQTSVRVDVRGDGRPVRDADVVVKGTTHHTGEDGSVVIPVAPGRLEIVVVKSGFSPAQVSVEVAANQEQPVAVALTRDVTVEEHVTVSATRTDRGIEEQPMRVEAFSKT